MPNSVCWLSSTCSGCLQTAARPCARAIDRFSHALANQSAHVPPSLIRTPHSSCAYQDAWAVVTPKRLKANFDTHWRVTLTHARFTQHHVQGWVFPILYFVPIIKSLAINDNGDVIGQPLTNKQSVFVQLQLSPLSGRACLQLLK